jgi:uncharacterized protein YjdB
MQYVDVKLKLQSRANVTKLSLYDYTGTFASTPASIYAVNGTTKTLLGTFTGASYMAWVDINLATPVTADTIIVRKYGNCIPQKVKVYGTSAGLSTPITGYGIMCTGSTTSLGNASWGGVWTSGNTAIATVNSGTGIVAGVSAGTATISYTISGLLATTTVTVNASANPGTITGVTSICPGGTTTFTASGGVTGGTWSSSATGVATVNSSGVITGVSAGTATITYSVANSCGSAVATKTIAVSSAFSAGSISGASSVCPGSTTTLTNYVTGGTWSSSSTGIATINSAGVVTGVANGTATISYTVTNSCGTARATKTITVNSTASAGSISGTATICPGSTTTLTSSVSGGTWTSSSTGVATVNSAGVVTGVSNGTATIIYAVSSSCGSATVAKVITVNSTASAGSISGAATVCPGSTTTLTSSVGGGAWTSSSTAVATVNSAGVVTGVSNGTATIAYTVASGCGTATATKTISVNSTPNAGSITGTALITVGATTTLGSTASGGSWGCSATSVATVSSAGVVAGLSAGTATVSYTVSGSCGTAAATKVVTVNASTGTSGTGSTLTSGRIPMDPKRWYQLNNCSNGLEGLHDGVLSATVTTGWGKILSNYDAYYPVLKGEKINIDSIKFYDGAGSNTTTPFTLYYIDSLWNKVAIATFTGTQYNSWVGPNPSSPSTYSLSVPANNVKYLVINCYGTYPNEMEVYGTYQAPSALASAPPKNIKLKQQFGVNAFEWDFEHPSAPLVIDESRMTAAKNFTAIRHYLDWEKLEPNDGGYTYNPSHSGSWNLDTMYARCKAEGMEMLVDIKTIPGWMVATYPTTERDPENTPVPYGSDFSNPASYIKQAKLGFQFAARYGNNPGVSSSLLSVDASTRWTGDPANVVKKGLNLVKYIECDNERDKWWKGRKAYQTGREYAANLSAFYDGHKNTMGPGVGVKNADSTMMVVMGGVATPTPDYLRGMIDWCIENRGYKADGSVNLCWDVINYHLYSDDGGSMQGLGTRGAAPEVAHADTFAAAFIKAAHAYAKDMPVWITETGYDINTGSVIKAIPIGSKTALQTQADWTLRTCLLNARMGIERTFFYMMYDDNIANPTKFASSGLINPDRSRKPAADYLRQANTLMGEYVYKETISTNPIVDRYELAGKSAYVLVKPTENGSTMSYTLNVGTTGSVRAYSPTIGQDTMNVATMSTSGTNVTLTVTETPLFVIPVASSKEGAAFNNPVDDIQAQSDILVYPNPTAGNVNFSIDNDKDGDVKVTVFTMSGQVCRSYQFTKATGKYTNTIDINNLPSGMYLIEFGQGDKKEIKKVIKVNQ